MASFYFTGADTRMVDEGLCASRVDITPVVVVVGSIAQAYWTSRDHLFTASYDETSWGEVTDLSVLMSPQNSLAAPGTKPAAIVFNNVMYIFWATSNGQGIAYTTCQDGKYTDPVLLKSKLQPAKRDFTPPAAGTSPTAVVEGSIIWLFWAVANGDIQFSCLHTDGSWTGVQDINGDGLVPGLQMQVGSSPTAVEFNGNLYVFHQGGGADGIWYAQRSQGTWASQSASVGPSITIANCYSCPAAFKAADESLWVIWYNPATTDCLAAASSSDGSHWTAMPGPSQIFPASRIDTTHTALHGVTFNSHNYVFWRAPGTSAVPYRYLATAPGIVYSLGFAFDTSLLADWMSLSMPYISGSTISQMTFAASHDSGMSDPFWNTNYAVSESTQTQGVNISGQLQAGVRWFDFRPCAGPFSKGNPGSNDSNQIGAFHGSNVGSTGHSFVDSAINELLETTFPIIGDANPDIVNTWQGGYGEALLDAVAGINDFTSKHNELIILNLSHLYQVPNPGANNGRLSGLLPQAYTTLRSILQKLNYVIDVAAVTKMSKEVSTWTMKDFLQDPDTHKPRAAVLVVWDTDADLNHTGTWPSTGSFALNNDANFGAATPVASNPQTEKVGWQFSSPGVNRKGGISLDYSQAPMEAAGSWVAATGHTDISGLISALNDLPDFTIPAADIQQLNAVIADPQAYTTQAGSDRHRRSLDPLLARVWVNPTPHKDGQPYVSAPVTIGGDFVGLDTKTTSYTTPFWAVMFNQKRFKYTLSRATKE